MWCAIEYRLCKVGQNDDFECICDKGVGLLIQLTKLQYIMQLVPNYIMQCALT
jgi:hypothetical protein